MILWYESTQAMRDEWIARGSRAGGGSESSPSWYGYETTAQTMDRSLNGDLTLVPKAEAMLDKIDQAVETPRLAWDRSPAGAFCSVPDVLAGLPTAMRRRREVQDERAPITILVSTMSSAGVEAQTLLSRGTTVLALVMALTRIRPVSLYQLTCTDGQDGGETVLLGRINTTPLDLATACYVLTSQGWSRRLTYQLAAGINRFKGGWPATYHYAKGRASGGGSYYERLVPRLGLNPAHTLVVEAPTLHDRLVHKPIEWINEQIARFGAEREELA